MKSEGDLGKAIPEGFEIYENPNAQVFLRRIPPKLITDQELNTVKDGMEYFSHVDRYMLDVKKETISIFTPVQDISAISEFLRPTVTALGKNHEDIQALLEQTLSFTSDLRFILVDKRTRLFHAQRYCYLGSIDDWIEIGSTDQLEILVKSYVKHIGQDSMYELL